MRFKDQLEDIEVGPSTPSGSLYQYLLNPLRLGGRLTTLARAFQQFRFRSIEIHVGVNMPTNITGNYTVAYTANPDLDFQPSIASRQVFQLPGAINKPWWQMGKSRANIVDRNKWYNIDSNSSEIMQTTQGKFIICNVSPPSTTAKVVVPIFAEYVIEFANAAYQNPEDPVQSFIIPAGAMVKGAGALYALTPNSGEPPIPIMPAGKPFYCGPSVSLLDANNDIIVCQVIMQPSTTAGTYQFYQTMGDFNESSPISGLGFPNFSFVRTTASSPN
jgi:hypothetical protein